MFQHFADYSRNETRWHDDDCERNIVRVTVWPFGYQGRITRKQFRGRGTSLPMLWRLLNPHWYFKKNSIFLKFGGPRHLDVGPLPRNDLGGYKLHNIIRQPNIFLHDFGVVLLRSPWPFLVRQNIRKLKITFWLLTDNGQHKMWWCDDKTKRQIRC